MSEDHSPIGSTCTNQFYNLIKLWKFTITKANLLAPQILSQSYCKESVKSIQTANKLLQCVNNGLLKLFIWYNLYFSSSHSILKELSKEILLVQLLVKLWISNGLESMGKSALFVTPFSRLYQGLCVNLFKCVALFCPTLLFWDTTHIPGPGLRTNLPQKMTLSTPIEMFNLAQMSILFK